MKERDDDDFSAFVFSISIFTDLSTIFNTFCDEREIQKAILC